MKHIYYIFLFAIFIGTAFLLLDFRIANSSTENLGVELDEEIDSEYIPDYLNWKRPPGPLKVGIQSGHYKQKEVPEELDAIRENGGSTNGKVDEWEVNLRISEEIKKILEKRGIVVEILPATIPPDYWADAFISIHADGNKNRNTSGFKISAPRRDASGKAKDLERILVEEYDKAIDMPIDPNITRNMTGYYAFSWRRYEHSIHPMTPAAIVETGFLTNPIDAKIIANTPEIPAQAIANGIIKFLVEHQLKPLE